MQVTFYFAGESTQVLDAFPWVRCASGNVYNENLGFLLLLEDCETEISITGGISGDSLRQRNEFIFYISEYVLYRI